LGSAKPGEKKTKVHLASAINGIIRERKLTQQEAARSLQITQPKVSALANYRLGGFSVERLMQFLNSLGCGVEIVVHKPRSRGLAQTVVTAAHEQDR
jgi:predicted XRE-type DNA-binding protein